MRIPPNVISFYTGAPLGEVPEYEDRRGRRVTFRAFLKHSGAVVDVDGEQTVFGFVIHYTIGLRRNECCHRAIWNKWSISEPITGMRVAYGASRRNALFNLALLVALHGGAEKFEAQIQQSVAAFKK